MTLLHIYVEQTIEVQEIDHRVGSYLLVCPLQIHIFQIEQVLRDVDYKVVAKHGAVPK